MELEYLAHAPLAAEALSPRSEPSWLSSGRHLTVLFGTETGTSADIARSVAEEATEKGISTSLVDMEKYEHRLLESELDALIIVSTAGEGDPPLPAGNFFEFVESASAPRLDGIRYSVLALGDSTYEFFCAAGKRLDGRFEELGANRLNPRVDCDLDYEEFASAWRRAVFDVLLADRQSRTAMPPKPAADAIIQPSHRPAFSPAVVVKNDLLVRIGSTKATRHIELSVAGSELRYEPGDALGIAVVNAASTVATLLKTVGLSASVTVDIKGQVVTLEDAFTRHFEITTATPRFLETWAELACAEPLRHLLREDRAGERVTFLRSHHVIDIIRRFPVPDVDPQAFARALRPLQPRLYSIASSQSVTPDEVHLTVAPLSYMLHGEPRVGVASGHLSDHCAPGATVPVYVHANPHFRLPADDMPMIMIGAGTGVAPYRAFLQERKARGAIGRSWLIFGERNRRTDFLYEEEWEAFLREGVLTRMDVAFSRDDAEKIYVQQRMRDQAADLISWLEEGAHLYLCGDANHLAPDVHQALIQIIAQERDTDRQSAEQYVRDLHGASRYQRDVY